MANINKQIKKSKEEIQSIMQMNLLDISESMIQQIIKNVKKLPRSKVLDSISNIKPMGVNRYKSDLEATLAVISSMAITQARKEVPKASKVKLMENEERLLFGEFERLPRGIRIRIKKTNKLLIGTHIADLQKAIFFEFKAQVVNEGLSGDFVPQLEGDETPEERKIIRETAIEELKNKLREKGNEFIASSSISAGSSITSANTINEARNAFFFSDDVLKEIEAFQFMNATPVAAICVDLSRGGGNGIIFSKNDPNAFKYTPPLHYNCESWIRPVLKLRKNQKIEKFEPTTKEIAATVQFSESIISKISEYSIKNFCCQNNLDDS